MKQICGSSIVSPDNKYRYLLTRRLKDVEDQLQRKIVLYIMLNPSTADAITDDQTIRKCTHYAAREGFTDFHVVNLFAYRATNPKDLHTAANPIGTHNTYHVLDQVSKADKIVAAWGANASRRYIKTQAIFTARAILQYRDMFCLGMTKDGHPQHPLMLRNDQPLIPWTGYK